MDFDDLHAAEQELIDGGIRSGRFSSRDEGMAWLDAEIKKGLDDLRAGRYEVLTDKFVEGVIARGRERLARERRKAS